MEPQLAASKFNGVQTESGNFMWGGAMCLAWTELKNNLILEPIQLDVNDQHTLKLVDNFNNAKFSIKDLDQSCYFVKSGFGNKTIREINEGTKTKFPQKTTQPLKQNLSDNGIISYAYFLKKLKFVEPFLQHQDLLGFGKLQNIKYFKAKELKQKKQVLIHHYKDQSQFMIQIESKNQNDQIFFIKHPNQKLIMDEVLQIHQKHYNDQATRMVKQDSFMMPYVKLEVEHHFDELKNKKLKTKNFNGYSFSDVFEIIKLQIDETGAKVENQAVIMLRGCAMVTVEPKYLHLDKQFWIVMQEKGKLPYFVACIKNPTK